MSDIILLGTENHVRLAERAARNLLAGQPVSTDELVVVVCAGEWVAVTKTQVRWTRFLLFLHKDKQKRFIKHLREWTYYGFSLVELGSQELR